MVKSKNNKERRKKIKRLKNETKMTLKWQKEREKEKILKK